MGFRQIFGGSTPPKYFTNGIPSNIWGSTPPKYFTDVVPSNIRGVYTPRIFHGWGSVKYLEAVDPQNISRMWFRQKFGESTPRKIFDGWGSVKYLGGLHPQNISRMGFRRIFGGLHHQNISRMWFRQIFGGSTPPEYFTDGVPSNIWGL